MTVINTIRHASAVYVLTDGAATGADEAITFCASKVHPMPQVNAVLALRGPYMLSAHVAARLQALAVTYDHFKDNIVLTETKKMFTEEAGAWSRVFPDPQIELIVAGFSEATGPDSYFICSHGRYGIPAWKMQNLTETSLLPASAAILEAFNARFPGGATPEDLDPVVDGIAAMEIQRKLAEPDNLSGGVVNAPGGFVQLTTVTLTEITTRIIHRWPDEIGGRISDVTR